MAEPGDSPPRLHRPLSVRCVNGVGRALQSVWGARPRLEADRLLDQAVARTKLDDFGGDAFREGLGVLLASLEGEAELHTIGRIAAERQVVDALATRLVFIDAEKHMPALAQGRVERPVFVLGLPRTGTTLLFGLLAADPSLRSPLAYEVARPWPPPVGEGADPRIERFDRDIDRFRRLAPGIDAIHAMGAVLPQECLLIMAYALTSLQFELCFHVPTYQKWYLGTSLREAYAFHRRFLTLLASDAPRRRWVLKSPAHLGSLDALFAEYPDATVIQTHRDPAKVIASVSSLHFLVRGASSDATSATAIGEEQTHLWSEMLARAMRARDGEACRGRAVTDVHYDALLADPIGTVRRIYDAMDAPLSAATEARMRAYLVANARDKHGSHRYRERDFGLDRDTTRARFAAYMDRFDVPREGGDDARPDERQ